MTFEQLIAKIDGAYPDEMLSRYAADPDENHGDPLASFIVVELRETFEADAGDELQLRAAFDKIDTAHQEVGRVVARLHALWERSRQGATP